MTKGDAERWFQLTRRAREALAECGRVSAWRQPLRTYRPASNGAQGQEGMTT
jgi:hypothetical protein